MKAYSISSDSNIIKQQDQVLWDMAYAHLLLRKKRKDTLQILPFFPTWKFLVFVHLEKIKFHSFLFGIIGGSGESG